MILSQGSDGSFEWSNTLSVLLGSQADSIRTEIENDKVRITALIVLFLPHYFAQESSLWEGVLQKSKTYLHKNGNPDVRDLVFW